MRNNLVERPSMPLAPVCAPFASVLASASWTAAMRAPLSPEHQVKTQAELARTVVLGDSGYGTTGFVGSTGISAKGGARGVPPRGRPV